VTVLHTERLVLRPLTPADLDDLVTLDSDPEVLRHTGAFADPVTPETYRSVLEEMIGTDFFWAAEEAGEFVGWFYLQEGELGFRLKRSAWGRGLATEGGRAVVEWAGGPLWSEALTAHAASLRVLEKLGFRVTGESIGDDGRPKLRLER
jgi:RimJ/RimL family protein N-acetyltransferase